MVATANTAEITGHAMMYFCCVCSIGKSLNSYLSERRMYILASCILRYNPFPAIFCNAWRHNDLAHVNDFVCTHPLYWHHLVLFNQSAMNIMITKLITWSRLANQLLSLNVCYDVNSCRRVSLSQRSHAGCYDNALLRHDKANKNELGAATDRVHLHCGLSKYPVPTWSGTTAMAASVLGSWLKDKSAALHLYDLIDRKRNLIDV